MQGLKTFPEHRCAGRDLAAIVARAPSGGIEDAALARALAALKTLKTPSSGPPIAT
jgi:hypothetical protein